MSAPVRRDAIGEDLAKILDIKCRRRLGTESAARWKDRKRYRYSFYEKLIMSRHWRATGNHETANPSVGVFFGVRRVEGKL
jgi:hypothetical protein